MKRVLDVGNCGPDHGAIVDLLNQHFDVEVVQAHAPEEALERLRGGSFDLVTVNRLMDCDGRSGLDLIEAIKCDDALGATPVMLISNYDSYQQEAKDLGAESGFGKAHLHAPETHELLRRYLG